MNSVMKMVILSYNEAVDAEIMEALEGCGIKYYTKITGVYGSGASSGIHLGNDIWPGRNSLLYIACKGEESKKLISSIKTLRKSLGKEGVKAFILPLEDVT